MLILLIDCPKSIADFFESTNYQCHEVEFYDGIASAISEFDYNLIVINDSISHVREIRQGKIASPILSLAASLTNMQHKISLLSTGADDVMSFPIHQDELLARARALIRRSNFQSSNQIQIATLTLDLDLQIVSRFHKLIHLTRTEYTVFELLALRQGRPQSVESIMDHVYTSTQPRKKIIDVYISRLRKTFRLAGEEYPIIETVPGRGYMIGKKVGEGKFTQPNPRRQQEFAHV